MSYLYWNHIYGETLRKTKLSNLKYISNMRPRLSSTSLRTSKGSGSLNTFTSLSNELCQHINTLILFHEHVRKNHNLDFPSYVQIVSIKLRMDLKTRYVSLYPLNHLFRFQLYFHPSVNIIPHKF